MASVGVEKSSLTLIKDSQACVLDTKLITPPPP